MPSDEIEQAAPLAAEFLTTKQAAVYCSMSEQYFEIARHRADGSGPPFIKLPRAVRYRRVDLDEWMCSHRRSGGEPMKRRERAEA